MLTRYNQHSGSTVSFPLYTLIIKMDADEPQIWRYWNKGAHDCSSSLALCNFVRSVGSSVHKRSQPCRRDSHPAAKRYSGTVDPRVTVNFRVNTGGFLRGRAVTKRGSRGKRKSCAAPFSSLPSRRSRSPHRRRENISVIFWARIAAGFKDSMIHAWWSLLVILK